ncbi:MAG TPA: twin-arginine translocase subunit TatC [bacterium]|nr:twin-arginine translocase subunit TatC [bacterium]
MSEEQSGSESAKEKSAQMGLIEHLDELRRRLIYALIAVGIGCIGGWFFSPTALNLIIPPTVKVQYLGPADAFMWRLRVAGVLGILIAAPILIIQIWLFIAPALKPTEKKMALPTIFSAIILFFVGGGFGISTVKYTLKVLEQFSWGSVQPNYSLDRYISFVTAFLFSFAVVFEIPVVLVMLAKIGIVSYKRLAASRRYALLIAVIAAAILTPTGDLPTLSFVAIPIYILYEISLLIIRFTTPKKAPETDE